MTSGSVFFIPRGLRHGFEETGPRRAICLVADWVGERKFCPGFLRAEAMAEVRARLALLGSAAREEDLSVAGTTLQIIALCLDSCHPIALGSAASRGLLQRLNREFRQDAYWKWPSVSELSKRMGFQKDYLNRLIRSGTGLTLGQWRAKKILRSVEADLRKRRKMAEVAERCGFTDVNYFTRWFRNQTGLPPKKWQQRSA